MGSTTEQIKDWSSDFGRDYTARNPRNMTEMDALYHQSFGITRTRLNEKFLAEVDRTSAMLEVGCNVGTQLAGLQNLGFSRLVGIDVQFYALELARRHNPGAAFLRAPALDLPFKDQAFDLVFTSGVLIHISPQDLGRALGEIHRCSRRFIWGWEYFHDTCAMIPYRGRDNLLWKANFAQLYLERFPDLEIVREERIAYLASDNVDTMFLLRKKG